MRLKNRKTGEIGYLIVGRGSDHYVVANNEWGSCGKYNSLSELNEDWTDYEEPKEWWYIDIHGPHKVANDDEYYQKVKAASKEIGNYFEAEEKAEKAMEKLKALKRLKDKGFRFDGCKIEMSEIAVPEITITAFVDTEEPETLNLVNVLFGGEE